MEKIYEWTITLRGYGQDEDEAWDDAVEGFIENPGPTPDHPLIIDDEEA